MVTVEKGGFDKRRGRKKTRSKRPQKLKEQYVVESNEMRLIAIDGKDGRS